MTVRVHTEQWGSSASTAWMLRLKPYQQAYSRTEQSWPLRGPFFWKGATFHCLWRRFKRERWGESLSYPVFVCTDPQRLMFIHPHMTKTEEKEGRKESIFLYISEVALHFLVVCNFDGQGRKNIYHNLLLLAILIRLRHSSSMRCRHPYSKTSWVCCWGQRWCPYALRGIFFW